MNNLLQSPLAFAALTFAVYAAAVFIYGRTKIFILHPVLVAIAVIIIILNTAGISYESYWKGGNYINIFLSPAVVALGVSLYREFEKIRKEAVPIIATTIFGSLSGVISAVVPALVMHLPPDIIISLAPKSVTTPIAMDIAESLGGIPSLSAAIVIYTGILGAVIGPAVLRILHITQSSAVGLAMGFSAHGIGTARAIEIGETEGAFSGLGICLNGLATSIITPVVIKFIF